MTEPPPPQEIRWLTDALGVEATLRLMEVHGGARLYVPAEPNQASPLAHAIGLQAARALATLRPAEEIKVPLAKRWRTVVYRARGMTLPAIARKLGIDQSTVARHLKPVPNRLQYDLPV